MENLDSIISIQDLLKGRNDEFDKTSPERIKMVRHADQRLSSEGVEVLGKMYYGTTLYDLYRTDRQTFFDYQSEQKRKLFENVDYIVAFIGEDKLDSRFVGVYKNDGIKSRTGFDKNGEEICVFNFQEVKGYDVLKERVIVNWRTPANGWNQYWNNTKEVVRIDGGLEHNNIPIFKRYEDVRLSYHELKNIINSNDSEWKSKLEACNCVYVILDKSNGKQYVGVTYKNVKPGLKSGIWSRWTEYADTGHGDDVTLKKLCTNDPNYAKNNFQWSILETLPLNIIPKLAIERESLYKEKLGTRKYGYNKN